MASRLFWTAGILSAGSFAFLFTNYIFGNLENNILPSQNTKMMPTDPAFAERLIKAKNMREGEKDQTKAS